MNFGGGEHRWWGSRAVERVVTRHEVRRGSGDSDDIYNVDGESNSMTDNAPPKDALVKGISEKASEEVVCKYHTNFNEGDLSFIDAMELKAMMVKIQKDQPQLLSGFTPDTRWCACR